MAPPVRPQHPPFAVALSRPLALEQLAFARRREHVRLPAEAVDPDEEPQEVDRRRDPAAVGVHPGDVRPVGVRPVVDDPVGLPRGLRVPRDRPPVDPAVREHRVPDVPLVRPVGHGLDHPSQQAGAEVQVREARPGLRLDVTVREHVADQLVLGLAGVFEDRVVVPGEAPPARVLEQVTDGDGARVAAGDRPPVRRGPVPRPRTPFDPKTAPSSPSRPDSTNRMIATDVIGFEMLAIRNRWDGRSSSPVDRSAVPYPSAKTSRSSREIATVSPGIP